jgi:hypothetical protein
VHLERECRQQAIVIAELQAAAVSLSARLDAARVQGEALRRYATAHGAAYGRLSGHAGALHQQLLRQLSSLLHLCRHLSLQVAAALAAADPTAALEAQQGIAATAEGGSRVAGEADAAGEGAAVQAAVVAAAALCVESLRTELRVAVQLLQQQAGSSEVQRLAEVPAGITRALAADLAGLDPALLASPHTEVFPIGAPASGIHSSDQGDPQDSRGSGAAPAAALVPTGPSSSPQGPPATGSPAADPASALSAQVAQMEGQLEGLVQRAAESAARAHAAAALQQEEQQARQHAQDVATELRATLGATQVGAARGGPLSAAYGYFVH